MVCLLCGEKIFQPYYYPPTRFNNKEFNYFECQSCYSAQLYPMPDASDYQKMYGVNDHKYLEKLSVNEGLDFTKKRPEYNHQKYQIDFFTKYKYNLQGKTLLDYGCGSGFYMYHAGLNGINCTGIEFDADFAVLLKEKTGLNILTLPQINGMQFDIIHLGHVLEHMEDPKATLDILKAYAHPETLFIIDGPLEKNSCLTRFFIKTVSQLKGNKFNTYPPQHITFTNYNSQLLFFKKAGLTKINYEVQEQMFPLPEKFDLRKPIRSALFILSRISITISKLNPRWGNIFHFAGKQNNY